MNIFTPRKNLLLRDDDGLPFESAFAAPEFGSLEADLQEALDEPAFLDRERQIIADHLYDLRGEAEKKIAAIEHHKAEIAHLEAELAERQLAIEAHEAAAAKLEAPK